MNAAEVRDAMRRRWCVEKGYALAFEVADQCGFDGHRRLDAVAIGLWTSTCLNIHAFEIKVSRADLRRELKNPAKSLEAARFCDTFSLVVPLGVTLDPLEVPKEWGIFRIGPEKARPRTWDEIMAKKEPPPPEERPLYPTALRLPAPLPHAPDKSMVPKEGYERWDSRRRPSLTTDRAFIAAFLSAHLRGRN